MHIMAPKNKWELSDMMKFAVKLGAPVAVRYPRGEAYDGLEEYREPICFGKSEMIFEEKENHQRFIKKKLDITAKAVRFIPLSTYFSELKNEDYGSSVAHLFNFEVF